MTTNTLNGYKAAQLYKFFAQKNNKYIQCIIPLERIRAQTLYRKYEKKFNKIVEVFNKYKINLADYFKFIMHDLGKTEKDADFALSCQSALSLYVQHLKIKQQYYKIYQWFIKSANNIVDQCIKLGFTSTKEYLIYLIKNKQLGAEYISGRISGYYLCSIQNFCKIYKKLDPLTKEELSIILQRYDKYKQDLIEAFKMYNLTMVRPLKFTDELLWKKINKQQ